MAWLLILWSPFAGHSARVQRAAFQSEHFEFLIDSSKTEIIPYLAARFESSYRRLSEFYAHRPDRPIQVLFLDEDDFSNGFAFSAQGWIVIFLPPADFDLRGKTLWLPNVISHELSHVITLRKMGETSRFLGYQLMAAFAFRDEGAVEVGAAFRWYNTPAWFAEGLAQLGSQICGHDTTDTFRRMILETALESGDLLSLSEMAAFGWDGRRNEMIYTQGYYLTGHLLEKYGREKMNQVLEAMRHGGFESAFNRVLARSPEELYRDWLEHLDSTVAKRSREPPPRAFIPLPGNAAYVNQSSPVQAADGSLAYLSSERNDFGITDLYVRKGGAARLVKRQADGPLNLSPDGQSVYFTCLSVSWKTGRITRDLYRYDFMRRLTSRLTWNGRVAYAAPDPTGTLYVFSEAGGRTRLSRLDKAGLVPIAEYPVQVNLSGLTQGGSSGTLLAEVATGRGADIFSVDVSNGRLTPVLASRADERDPRWFAGEGRLLFSADYGGAYQVYSLRNDSITRLTHDDGNRLDPMAHAGNLFSRIYSRDGFVLDSVPISDLEPLDFPRDSLLPNQAFPPAAPVELVRKKWGDDGMKYLGFLAFTRLVRAPEQPDLFQTTDETSPLYRVNDPGGYFKWTAGGAGVWMHPGEESSVYLQAGVADEWNHAMDERPYLSETLALYSNRSFGPEFGGYFESSTHRIPREGLRDQAFAYTLLRLSLSLNWRLNNYLSLAGFGNYSGVSVRAGQGLLTDFSGGGALFGNLFQITVSQPGVDFPNQLFSLQSGLGYAPGFGINESVVNWNTLALATNSRRRVFYRASVSTVSLVSEDFRTDFRASAFLSLRFHTPLRFPMPGSRSLFLTNFLPSLGMTYVPAFTPDSPVSSIDSGIRRNHPQPGAIGTAALPSEYMGFWEDGRIDMISSATLKMISPLKNVVHWNFYYALPIQGESRDAHFGINLSL